MKKLGVGLFVALMAVAPVANAFCGFYVSGADTKLFNNATHVVLMREGTRTVLSMQNNYQGPPSDFAMVVPVPVVLQKENVKTLEKAVFEHIDQLSAPRLVEYWEQDPCGLDDEGGGSKKYKASSLGRPTDMPAKEAKADDLGVRIEAKFTVGEYDIVVLSAKDSGGLEKWLKQENYKIPDGAGPYLAPYVQAGSKFFVAKVDVTKVKFGTTPATKDMADLSPLRFHYDTETFSLPVRLGLMNSQGTQDLIVNVLSKGQRYEVANYPNATIPTNFDVAENAKSQFGPFYAALFDRTLAKISKVVVTEYSWDAMSCDPCPTPPLSTQELNVLGMDSLPEAGDRGSVFKGGGRGMTLTRLHARYGKESLGEDLVFRTAQPIFGGREVRDAKGQLEHDAVVNQARNSFQARYAVRHPWTGAVKCKDPRRGIWGGPPGGRMPKSMPAQNLAFAPRGKLELASFVKGSIPDAFALPGAVTPLGSPVVPVPALLEPPPPFDAGAAPPEADAGAAAPPPPVPPQKTGCGCDVPGQTVGFGGVFTGLALALAAVYRRRTTPGR
jgi:hypothetical protein